MCSASNKEFLASKYLFKVNNYNVRRTFTNIILVHLLLELVKNYEEDGLPSTKNLFGQSVLLINATYIVFP